MNSRERAGGSGRPLRTGRALRWVSVSLLAVALLWAPASIAATPADTTATHAYLQAVYQLDLAMLRNAAASRSASTTIAERLGDECHGVLAGAPTEEFGPRAEGPTTPRARGERQRSELQKQTIEEELELTVYAATYQPDRAAIEAFATQVAPLSWSDPRIAPLARFHAHSLEEHIVSAPADVCADMKTWAQSGYHILSAASREFEAARTARINAVAPEGSIGSLLKPYEGPRERSLIRKTKAVLAKRVQVLRDDLRGFSHLLRALGVPESPFETHEHEPLLGHGTTSAGGSFTVRSERPESGFGPSCRSVSVEIKEASGGSGTSVCLSRQGARQLSTECGSGVETITTAVPASVRSARLQLSDGRTITSRVIRVPRRYGGPAGVYVQAVRGYSPYPVSLTELNAQGDVVLELKLASLRCRKEPARPRPRLVTLASGSTPDGEPFAIEGISFRFGPGPASFRLELDAGLQRTGETGAIEVGNAKPKAFSWSLGMECPPHEFAIVYGILSAPASSVLARTPAGLVPLTQVAIAANLHSGGPLAYGVFSTPPSELVVRRSDGSTLYTESLAARDKEEAEFCEGYAEG
ncbi:MAG: hypothetical protein ACLPUT_11785 [Solirubrobacteraceae bacterium]